MFLNLLMILVSANPPSALDVAGTWANEERTVHLSIADCGDGTPCGTIAWVSKDLPPEKRVDRHNPQDNLRTRPLLGIRMLWGFERDDDAWTGGRIYNPKDGDTYRSTITLVSKNRIEVKGCWGPFCKTKVWTRVEP